MHIWSRTPEKIQPMCLKWRPNTGNSTSLINTSDASCDLLQNNGVEHMQLEFSPHLKITESQVYEEKALH